MAISIQRRKGCALRQRDPDSICNVRIIGAYVVA